MKSFFLKFVISAFIVLSVLIYAFIATYAGLHVYNRPETPADTVIILGARSQWGDKINPCLAARVDEGTRVLNAGKAQFVIVTGGIDEYGGTEAETMARLLAAKGIPRSKIILEPQATSTYENLVYSKALMKSHGLLSAIIVTEPFHIPRADLIASHLGITHQLSSADTSPCWSRWKWASRYFLREPAVIILYKLQGKI
jgi:uncharacterized SAM-binding protein YcdF (DUF218 family)